MKHFTTDFGNNTFHQRASFHEYEVRVCTAFQGQAIRLNFEMGDEGSASALMSKEEALRVAADLFRVATGESADG